MCFKSSNFAADFDIVTKIMKKIIVLIVALMPFIGIYAAKADRQTVVLSCDRSYNTWAGLVNMPNYAVGIAHDEELLYDLAEAAAESVCGKCSAFCVSVLPDAETLLAIEADAPFFADTQSVPDQADYTLTESDGTYQLRIGGVRNVS